MIKIKLTWPVLILLLITLAVWLAHDPGARKPSPLRRPASQSRRRQPTPARGGSDYATETRRLDEAAAAAGQQILDQAFVIDMPEPSWRKKS